MSKFKFDCLQKMCIVYRRDVLKRICLKREKVWNERLFLFRLCARQSILEFKWFDYFSPHDFKGVQI